MSVLMLCWRTALQTEDDIDLIAEAFVDEVCTLSSPRDAAFCRQAKIIAASEVIGPRRKLFELAAISLSASARVLLRTKRLGPY